LNTTLGWSISSPKIIFKKLFTRTADVLPPSLEFTYEIKIGNSMNLIGADGADHRPTAADSNQEFAAEWPLVSLLPLAAP
jgi:hypothetical protein